MIQLNFNIFPAKQVLGSPQIKTLCLQLLHDLSVRHFNLFGPMYATPLPPHEKSWPRAWIVMTDFYKIGGVIWEHGRTRHRACNLPDSYKFQRMSLEWKSFDSQKVQVLRPLGSIRGAVDWSGFNQVLRGLSSTTQKVRGYVYCAKVHWEEVVGLSRGPSQSCLQTVQS